ncbi:hypothetical protein H6G33_09795 [Calothrix sp. FACHB-1219]|uniref:hypothetical protein n=1 Tax=unclassified Calothrix TaxID=2619626 RepID=UPI001681F494|nr:MULTISPECIES: hypothetical protein [unclassified Calothrix]MBD2201638.1 hypothetical protein [Calothrix sp. FACHB-168]MBD2217324.1 hypothetical protein [Calothrix sp. FACHB-1219]
MVTVKLDESYGLPIGANYVDSLSLIYVLDGEVHIVSPDRINNRVIKFPRSAVPNLKERISEATQSDDSNLALKLGEELVEALIGEEKACELAGRLISLLEEQNRFLLNVEFESTDDIITKINKLRNANPSLGLKEARDLAENGVSALKVYLLPESFPYPSEYGEGRLVWVNGYGLVPLEIWHQQKHIPYSVEVILDTTPTHFNLSDYGILNAWNEKVEYTFRLKEGVDKPTTFTVLEEGETPTGEIVSSLVEASSIEEAIKVWEVYQKGLDKANSLWSERLGELAENFKVK